MRKRLNSRHSTWMGRTVQTSAIHRAPCHAHGHAGSKWNLIVSVIACSFDRYVLSKSDAPTACGYGDGHERDALAALDELVHEGKVRYIGSSNFDAWQVVDAEWLARRDGVTRFVSAQNRYNLLERDAEAKLAPACERYGIGIIPFFPLASGLLTG